MLNQSGDSWRPLDCVFCNNQPQKIPIYSCKAGHLVCASCFGVLLHQTDSKNIHLIHCKLCNAEITNTRNLIAELLVENAQNSKFNEILLPNLKQSIESISTSESESSFKEDKAHVCNPYGDRRCRSTADTSSMLNVKSASRRPICCPEYTCRHMVAVASLVSHFEFEHPRTLKLELVPDVREDFVVSCDIFNQAYYYLIALLLIGDDHKTRRNRSSVPLNKNVKHLKSVCTHLPVAVLCSILTFPIKPSPTSCESESPSQISFDDCNSLTGGPSTSSNRGRTVKTNGKVDYQGSVYSIKINKESYDSTSNINDFIIIWASTLDTESIDTMSCTIELSDFEHKLLYRYHGNLNSIRDNQEPSAVFSRANCLVVQCAVLSKIITDDEEFIISVIIHYDKNL